MSNYEKNFINYFTFKDSVVQIRKNGKNILFDRKHFTTEDNAELIIKEMVSSGFKFIKGKVIHLSNCTDCLYDIVVSNIIENNIILSAI